MVKILLVGFWVVGVLSGSAYYFAGQKTGTDTSVEANTTIFGGLDYVTLDPMTIAIIRDNQVKGYLILETVFTIKQSVASKLSVPIEYVLRDIIIAAVHANPDIDIFRIERFELKEFQKLILAKTAEKLERKVVYDFLVQRIDFISKDDVRDLQLRRS